MRNVTKKVVVAASAIVLAASAASAATVSSTTASKTQALTAPSTQPAPQLRQEIRDQLAKAGLTDIKVAPEEYVVHAKNKNGDAVAMAVTPNSFLEVTDVKMSNPSDAHIKQTQVEPDPTPLAKQH
jgi:hypothetical protein